MLIRPAAGCDRAGVTHVTDKSAPAEALQQTAIIRLLQVELVQHKARGMSRA